MRVAAPGRGFSAAIFDLDGTLVDSESVYLKVDREFFASWDFDFTEEFCRETLGLGTLDFFRLMGARWPDNPLSRLPLAERARLRDAHALERAVPLVRPFPAMPAFVAFLAERGLGLGIGSGSGQAVIAAILERTGLARHFQAVVSAEEVGRGKPSPDVFLETARRLGVPPGDCVVFEDSAAGVAAAAAAGMACVALPEPGSDLAPFASARRIFPGGAASARLDELVAAVESAALALR